MTQLDFLSMIRAGPFTSFAPYLKRVSRKEAMPLIKSEHYSKTMHNGPFIIGAFSEDWELMAVCAFATPISEHVRALPFGKSRVNEVTELHRLAVKRPHPSNFTSWFLSKSLKILKERKPRITCVISFADPNEGHIGTVYQATNAIYTGTTVRATQVTYRDDEGRLRTKRQNGKSLTFKEATEDMGWEAHFRESKHRYLYLLPDGSGNRRMKHKRQLLKDLKLDSLPYPKE